MLLETLLDFGKEGSSSLPTSLSAKPPEDPMVDPAKFTPGPLRLVSKERSAVRKINEDP